MGLIIGTAGPDMLAGTAVADEVQGLGGDDMLSGLGGDDTLLGGPGNDRLDGGLGDDLLDGGTGNDQLMGGEGDDTLVARAATTSDGVVDYQGGAGRDTLQVLAAGVAINLAAGTVSFQDDLGNLVQIGTVSGIEAVTSVSTYQHLTLIGSDGDDQLTIASPFMQSGQYAVLMGGGGNDRLDAGIGGGRVEGGSGDDLISYGKYISDYLADGEATPPPTMQVDGGDGTDILSFGDFTLYTYDKGQPRGITYHIGVTADLAAGTIRNLGVDSITGVENLVGTAYGDSLYGDAGWNWLAGAAGDDVIIGGLGNDSLDGGGGFDWLVLQGATAATLTDLAAGTGQDGLGGIDVIAGFEAVRGSDQVDAILGDDGGNILIGEAGDDMLSGRGGNDLLTGGAGNDQLGGGEGDDQLDGGPGDDSLAGGEGHDTVLMTGMVFRSSSRMLDDAGLLQVTSADGADTVARDIEEIRFLDGSLLIAEVGSPEAMVLRLYGLALGRTPDAGGQDYWAARLQAGESLSTIADGIVGSAEFATRNGTAADNAGFVQILYSELLNRPADAGGMAFWTGVLDAGSSRGAVVAGFSDSAENRALTAGDLALGQWRTDAEAAAAARLYDTLLGRLPDFAELAAATTALDGHGAAAEITLAGTLMASAEFRNGVGTLSDAGFVGFLYSTALDRQVDAGAQAFWTDALAAGLSRAELAVDIAGSAEHVALLAPLIDEGIVIA